MSLENEDGELKILKTEKLSEQAQNDSRLNRFAKITFFLPHYH